MPLLDFLKRILCRLKRVHLLQGLSLSIHENISVARRDTFLQAAAVVLLDPLSPKSFPSFSECRFHCSCFQAFHHSIIPTGEHDSDGNTGFSLRAFLLGTVNVFMICADMLKGVVTNQAFPLAAP
jgi:hypothetical protein